ncbi:MAG: hypothetical protein JKY42_12290 [Flavobacteriales bacterium]|nr:hypothetical protein [Flavobacteriales bacterium]
MENTNKNRKGGGTGKVFTETYNPQRIGRLKNIITDFRQQGKPKRYCILVDGEMIVSINKDPSNFDNYKRYLETHTQTIEVRMFFGDSPNCNKHLFHTSQASLSGTQKGVQEQIEEALEKQRIKAEIETLRSKLKRKNKIIEEYEETIDEYEKELDKKKLDVKGMFKDGMELLGQWNTKNNGAKPVQGIPDTTVEVKAETETKPEAKSDKFYQKMKNKYSQESLDGSLKIWSVWLKHPELKDEFMKIVKQKIKEDGEA